MILLSSFPSVCHLNKKKKGGGDRGLSLLYFSNKLLPGPVYSLLNTSWLSIVYRNIPFLGQSYVCVREKSAIRYFFRTPDLLLPSSSNISSAGTPEYDVTSLTLA